MISNCPYEFIANHETLYKRLNEFVSIYNSKNKTAPMDVVFFDYFIGHILRVCRILSQPHGYMVLIGHGGRESKQYVNWLVILWLDKVIYLWHLIHQETSVYLNLKKLSKILLKKSNYYPLVLLLNDNNVGWAWFYSRKYILITF